eukprot:SAG22_NODE_4430_length_1272_cov_0.953112_1_plen_50_part_10
MYWRNMQGQSRWWVIDLECTGVIKLSVVKQASLRDVETLARGEVGSLGAR